MIGKGDTCIAMKQCPVPVVIYFSSFLYLWSMDMFNDHSGDHSGVRKNRLHVRKSVNRQGLERPEIINFLGCQDTFHYHNHISQNFLT